MSRARTARLGSRSRIHSPTPPRAIGDWLGFAIRKKQDDPVGSLRKSKGLKTRPVIRAQTPHPEPRSLRRQIATRDPSPTRAFLLRVASRPAPRIPPCET